MGKSKKTTNKSATMPIFILFILTVIVVGAYRFMPLFEQLQSGPELKQGAINAHFLDVGQGDAALVQIPNEDGTYFNLLIDSGEYSQADTLLESLDGIGVEKLDAIVASHPHADHIGAMATVIENYDVENFYTSDIPDSLLPTTKSYETMLDALIEFNVPVTYLEAGDSIDTGTDARIEILSPFSEEEYEDLNDYSIVMKISLFEQSFLFTGDAERAAIDLMIEKGMNLEAKVLKVPHHGSTTSTYEEMLESIKPEIAVISCGEDNSYGHPHDEVVKYLEDFGCEIKETAKEGNILIN